MVRATTAQQLKREEYLLAMGAARFSGVTKLKDIPRITASPAARRAAGDAVIRGFM
jgi:hypothetical protein